MARKWMFAIGALIIAAIAGFRLIRRAPPKSEPVHAVSAQPAEAILTGRVQPRTVVSVPAPAEGILESWSAEIGQPVYKDQLLCRIRVPKLEAGRQQAQSDLDQTQSRVANLEAAQMAAKLEISRAEAEQTRSRGELDRLEKVYQREKGLWDAGAIARLAFEKTQKDYAGAKASVERSDIAAKAAGDRAASIAQEIEAVHRDVAEKTQALDQSTANLGSGDLHSPADGIVVARTGQPGEPIDPAIKNLVEIATGLTELQVTLAPSPLEIGRMQVGQPATVRLDADEFPGVIREIRGPQVVVDFTTSAPIPKLDLTAQVKIKF